MSMPAGACGIERAVAGGYVPISDARALDGVEAIVVMDGGTQRLRSGDFISAAPVLTSVERGLEAARLYRMKPVPLVVVTGGSYEPTAGVPEGAALRGVLIDAGVPADKVLLDDQSPSTAESARNVPALLRARGIVGWAVVTSAVHMRRTVRAFRTNGGAPVPAPAAAVSCEGGSRWWPAPSALERSYQAIYEVFGLTYYAARSMLG